MGGITARVIPALRGSSIVVVSYSVILYSAAYRHTLHPTI